MPINLHFQKLGGRSQLRAYRLPSNHLICSLIDSQLNPQSNLKAVTLNSFSNRQHSLVKGHLVDMANQFNKCFLSFTHLDLEFFPGRRVIDNFSEHISFNIYRKGNNDKLCKQELNEMVLENSSSSSIAIIVSDASIKNNVATSIAHIHAFNKPLVKTIHYAVHVTSTEAELFAIRCGINQSLSVNNIFKIVVITDSIHVVKKVFDPSIHPYQT